jgi:hypothetical protein
MPIDTVCPMPNGLPIASTTSPTRASFDDPIWIGSQPVALARMTARSVSGSVPMSLSGRLLIVGRRNENLVCVGDDVRVRQNVAVAAHDDARSQRVLWAADPARSQRRRVRDSAAARRSDAIECAPLLRVDVDDGRFCRGDGFGESGGGRIGGAHQGDHRKAEHTANDCGEQQISNGVRHGSVREARLKLAKLQSNSGSYAES